MSALLRFALLVLVVTLSPSPTQATNKYRDHPGDFQNELTAQGYTVYTAAVGPFASNWDRACELYAIIKGGQVDYGQKHSATHNHLRYGRNYTGLYPKWGTANSDGSINKVHLVGHSMGGQTVRMLAQLLGTARPVLRLGRTHRPHVVQGRKELGALYHDHLHAQPRHHLGQRLLHYWRLSQGPTGGCAECRGNPRDSAKMVYDAKLDQWGITTKQSGESIQAYLDRVFSSRILTRASKTCVSGAYPRAVPRRRLPQRRRRQHVLYGLRWSGGRCYVRGASQLGKWNKMPLLNRLDHLAVVGITLHTQVLDLYEGHAALLYALPASSSSRRLADAPAAVAKLDTAMWTDCATTSVETKSDLESLCQSPKNSYAQSYCTKMLEAAPRVVYEDRRQRLRWKTVELCSPCVGLKYAVVSHATNTYPVVLVHGFGGWGRDELLGFKYWGGIQGDIQEELEALGYTVYTASIGPFSSNWDRACELPQYGRSDHPNAGSDARKGHNRSPVEETTYTSPLFEGGHDWIHSITTISTPNQGTTLADGFSEIGDTIKDLLVSIINVLGIFGDSVDLLYDAQLDQWGITAKQDDETLQEYFDRAFSSSIFDSSFKDVSIWSLSVAGAKEESMWVETLDDVYYYSYATKDTFSTYNWKLQKISYPNILTMLLPLDVLSIFLGSRYAPDTLSLTTDWQPNDGAVNTISMNQDYVGDIVEFDGSSVIGKWNQMTQLTGLDHLAVTGITLLYQIFGIYEAHAELLYSLPTQEDLEALCEDPINTYAENYCANMLNATLVNDTIATANATVEAATNTSINTDVSSTRMLRG
ncbi:Alpha/Beta hydrolase fold [Phytophthora cactorum]|nr:Alpha/Beta hydrolase fold [Phytophthora cactorum]